MMFSEQLAEEHVRDLARDAAHHRLVQQARCGRRPAHRWTQPLRSRVGRWLIASGRHLVADGEQAG